MALVAGLAFVPVYLGLIAQIRKIAVKDRPTTVLPVLMIAHIGRFAFWALLGAVLVHTDPISGWMLLGTRSLGIVLVGVTLVQRRDPRPSMSLLAKRLLPWISAHAALTAVLVLVETPGIVRTLLDGGVLLCFAILIFWALPAQIIEIRRSRDARKLRFFQLALLGNYAVHFVYALTVPDERLRLVMLAAYAPAVILQAVLVYHIERSRLWYRRSQVRAS